MTTRSKAVFIDRDGTISEDKHFLKDPDDLELIPGSTKGIKMLNKMGYKIIVVTNQSGVARGYFSEDSVKTVNARLKELLKTGGAHIDALYYCPHHPTDGIPPYKGDCECRKPATGMIDSAVSDFNIDPSVSYVVGDKLVDIELAHRAGAKGILVKTGYGNKEIKRLSEESQITPDYIAENLLEAATWIKEQP